MTSLDSSLKLKVFSGVLWRVTEKVGANVVRFVVSIVLARLLAPEIFGVVAIVMAFISFADLFVESGIVKSLIQNENVDEVDFSSVFYFTTAVSIALYVLLFFAAPVIASLFDYTQLTSILRIMNLRLLLSGFNIAQSAYASRTMQFKWFFWATSGAVVVSASVAIFMAYAGFGVWVLVVNHLVSSVIYTTILWFTLKWRPTLNFSWQRMKILYSYGWKLFVSNIVFMVYGELQTLSIGRFYTTTDLAFYSRGRAFPALISDISTRMISSVTFPVISQKQKSTESVKSMMRQSMSSMSYLIWPMMVGLVAVAEPLVLLLLTETWIEAVPFLQIACICFALHPIHEVNVQAINAIGRSDITLKLRIVKTIVGIAILLLAIRYGVIAIALSSILTSVIFVFINILPTAKLINYKFAEQMADVLPYAGLSVIMFIAIYPLRFLQMSDTLIVLLQTVVGAGVYLLLSIITKVKALYFISNTIKQFFGTHRKLRKSEK